MTESFDYDDDAWWSSTLATASIEYLEEIYEDIQDDVADLIEDRLYRKAKSDAFLAQEHSELEYRQHVAQVSLWRAELQSLERLMKDRARETRDAMKDRIGVGESVAARNVIHRLALDLIRAETAGYSATSLDSVFLIAQGRKKTIREFVDGGSKW